MMSTEQFSLRWNNFHSNLTSGFHDLMQANDMVDVTLAVDGQFLQAHKLVLSICSPLFKQLFKINPCKHPVIILRDVTYENLKDILAFMYLGEVNVLRDNLSTFLRTAELLQVKGLTSDDSSDTSSKKDDKSDTTCDNDMEQDIHQFNTMMASSDLEPISYTPSPQPHSVKRTSQNISGQSKRSKSDQTSTPIIEKQERCDSPIQIEEDGEYMENTNFEPYPCEGEEVSSNREAIKQFLECNNVNVLSTQDSSSQDHDL
uniref:BTB domain-containing protein n=1 Tax=Photinus pyralis TaxID=7054 RepID=A0A1Y1LRS3_PHOPY